MESSKAISGKRGVGWWSGGTATLGFMCLCVSILELLGLEAGRWEAVQGQQVNLRE